MRLASNTWAAAGVADQNERPSAWRRKGLGLASAIGLGAAMIFGGTAPAHAAGMFLNNFAGASSFGLGDNGSNVPPFTCPDCDSTVNFAVYSNPDRDDWRTASEFSGLAPTFLDSSGQTGPGDTTARWVFLYQVENTNLLPGGTSPDPNLEDFNVTASRKGGPLDQNPYTSGGFFNMADLVTFNSAAALDIPNDGAPTDISARTLAVGNDDTNPATLNFVNAGISSVSVLNGAVSFPGAQFAWSGAIDGTIPPSGRSDVLFLTSNAESIGFTWGETESGLGFGAAGDVVGVAELPEPATLGLFGLGLIGLGFATRRQKRA